MRISIVTINYNNLSGLKETVSSVISLGYSNVDYIIIDGGSTDGSKEFIETLSDNKIAYWVSERDGGLYDAMNKGLKAATGEYVLFMNSGDKFFKTSSLNHLADEANLTGADVIFGSALYFYPEGYVLRQPQKLDVMACELPFCHQAVMVRTSLAMENPFNTELRFIADYDMFYKLWKGGRRFKMVDEIVAVYDASGVSASKNNLHRIYEEQCIIHGINSSEFRYKVNRLKATFRDCVRHLLPVKYRNILLGRKQDDLSYQPIEYFTERYN